MALTNYPLTHTWSHFNYSRTHLNPTKWNGKKKEEETWNLSNWSLRRIKKIYREYFLIAIAMVNRIPAPKTKLSSRFFQWKPKYNNKWIKKKGKNKFHLRRPILSFAIIINFTNMQNKSITSFLPNLRAHSIHFTLYMCTTCTMCTCNTNEWRPWAWEHII